MMSVLLGDKKRETHRKKEDHVKLEAEIEVIQSQTKECQGLLATSQCFEKGRARSSLETLHTNPVHTLILDFWPSKL